MKPANTNRINPEHTKTEDMKAKFGEILNFEENSIRRFILTQTPVLGRVPLINEVKEAFNQLENEEVVEILEKFHDLDILRFNDDKTMILAAYPFSGSKTSHLITFKKEEYKKVYAMCAVDALGISFMLDLDISIKSNCYHCNEEINIEIENNEIISLIPKEVVVWCDVDYSCCAATSICKNINFFSSEEHFVEWQKKSMKKKGFLVQIQEAFYLGKLFFEKRLEN